MMAITSPVMSWKFSGSLNRAEKILAASVSQQRFPDLSLGGRLNPPTEALESKGSMRPWAIQSHYYRVGWYLVWRYLVDATKSIKPDRTVLIWLVDVGYLRKQDWKK
jgi:hypothetical protein